MSKRCSVVFDSWCLVTTNFGLNEAEIILPLFMRTSLCVKQKIKRAKGKILDARVFNFVFFSLSEKLESMTI